MIWLKRIAVALVVTFVVAVFGLFALNFYRRVTGDDELRPPVIFERTDRPSRA